MQRLTAPVFAAFGEADHIISIADVQRLRNCLTVRATRSASTRARRTAGSTTPCQGAIAGHRRRLPAGATAIPVQVFAGGYDPRRAACTMISPRMCECSNGQWVREGLTHRGMTWVVGVPHHLNVYPVGVQMIWSRVRRGFARQHAMADAIVRGRRHAGRCQVADHHVAKKRTTHGSVNAISATVYAAPGVFRRPCDHFGCGRDRWSGSDCHGPAVQRNSAS
jgi:hypothetical protein